jgi:8-oxo-dGTP pyrophosphatase MutT (NUDIX family)
MTKTPGGAPSARTKNTRPGQTARERGAGVSLLFSAIRDYATESALKRRSAGDAIIPQKPKKRRTRPVVRVQYGALPYRFTAMASLEILIVTTRQSRRWIVPKGWPIKRLTPSKSAAREAFEEAGVRGRIGARAIGNFTYKKTARQTDNDPDYEVKIFPLLVRRQSATWPEHGQRVVQWVDPEKAISLIREPELKAIVAKFAKRASVAASRLIY